LKTKIKKFEKFFILCPTKTYAKNGVYIFVDFRIKRADPFNYGGGAFFPPAKKRQILTSKT